MVFITCWVPPLNVKLTGQRPVGIAEENGTTFSDQIGPPKRNGSHPVLFPFRILYISEEKRAMNPFVKS